MSERQQDLRYKKAEQRLLTSLEQLLKQGKPIKVCELCRHAGMFESTFYRHYRSLHDLISQKEKQIIRQFDQVLARASRRQDDLPRIIQDTLIFIHKNRADLRLLAYISHDKILLSLMAKLQPLTTRHWQPYTPSKRAFIFDVYSHEVVAVITTWGQQEDFATDHLIRHEHDIIYLTETAVKRLNYLVS